MKNPSSIRRALLSVSDKTGLISLAQKLMANKVELIATGSTAKFLTESGIPVIEVSKVTQFPEMLDGRVKTLHPNIHAGLLADKTNLAHMQQLEAANISSFDLLVCNLYPFQETVIAEAEFSECIENIDIGGPALIRAAAKNFSSVTVVVDPNDYASVEVALVNNTINLEFNKRLAIKAFQVISDYDIAIASWLAQTELALESDFPSWKGNSWTKKRELRYGENPHQKAALYISNTSKKKSGLANAEQLNGKQMSYNNYIDTDTAFRCVFDFSDPTIAIIKHANPCGIASHSTDLALAYQRALACDSISAFGGVVASNRIIDINTAKLIATVFTEVVIAPGYAAEALEILQTKNNLRVLVADFNDLQFSMQEISGGMLVQQADKVAVVTNPNDWNLVTGRPVSADILRDLVFAWKAVRSVKSNGILLAANKATVGIGMGQVNRVDAAKLAIERSAGKAKGAVAASDAFFPFADGLELLIAAGITAVVQPGGSVRDAEVIAVAKAAQISMYFTGMRHFSH